jgi:hypothetical protein
MQLVHSSCQLVQVLRVAESSGFVLVLDCLKNEGTRRSFYMN